MKIAVLVARILLGVIFLTFGLNGFVPFLPMPPMEGLAGQFFGAVGPSHYMLLPFLLQVIGGALLLANQFVPLALTLLGPVIVNILLFHICMAPSGLPLAFIVAILWFIVYSRERAEFAGIFRQRSA